MTQNPLSNSITNTTLREISYKSLFKIVSVVFLVWLLIHILDVLIIIFVSIILSASIKPVIKQLDKYKIPKNLATMFIVFGFAGTLVSLLYLGVRPIYTELSYFFSHFGEFLDSISKNYNITIPNQSDITEFIRSYSSNLGGGVSSASGQIFRIGTGFFNALITTLALVALTFYQLAEDNKLRNFIASLFGKNAKSVRRIIDRSESKLGSWFRSQLSLMVFIGIITYIALFIVGLTDPNIAKFALPLAVIAGVLEVVPVLGPTLALIPAIFVGAAVSPIYALVILLIYLGIQQVESNIVIPRVMNKAVGLDPIAVIVGIMIGNTVLGPLGSFLSVPVMAVGSVLYDEWRKNEVVEEE
jgi:predicted PurR-regulated permease PerM